MRYLVTLVTQAVMVLKRLLPGARDGQNIAGWS